MANEKSELAIIIVTSLKGSKRVTAGLKQISDTTKQTSNSLKNLVSQIHSAEISFSRLFKIVFLYVLAFESLHKVINLTSTSIETMVQYNKQMEDLTLGIATVINMIGEIEVDGRKLEGIEKFNTSLQVSQKLMEQIREASLKAFVPIEAVAETFQAIVGFALQAGATLEETVDLAVKFGMAVQALQLPMNQVVQEARDLLQGGIQPASSTLAVILGINDQLIKQWKEQGILIEELQKRLKSLEYVMSAKFDTLSGKIYAVGFSLRRALGEGGVSLFQALKIVLDDVLKSLFEVEKIVDKTGKEFYKIVPKKETLNVAKDIGDTLARLLINTYSFIKAGYIWMNQNKEILNLIKDIFIWWVKIKIALFAAKNLIARIYGLLLAIQKLKAISLAVGGFIFGKEGAKNLFNIFKASLVKLLLLFTLVFPRLSNIVNSFLKVISVNWKRTFVFLSKVPFRLIGVFIALSGAIKGIWDWLINQLKSKFSDFFGGWLTDKLKALRSFFESIGAKNSDIVRAIDKMINWLNEPVKSKGLWNSIIQGYKDVFGLIERTVDEILKKLKEIGINLDILPKLEKYKPTPFSQMWKDINKELEKMLGKNKENEEKWKNINVYAKEFQSNIEETTEELKTFSDLMKLIELQTIEYPYYQNYGQLSIEQQIKNYRNAIELLRELYYASPNLSFEEQVEYFKTLTEYYEKIKELRQKQQELYDDQLKQLKERYDFSLTKAEYSKDLERQIGILQAYRERLLELAKTGKLSEKALNDLYKELTNVNNKLDELNKEWKIKYGSLQQGIKEGWENIKKEMASAYLFGQEMIEWFVNMFEYTIAQSLFDFFTGRLRKLKDFLYRLRDLILQIISQIIARLIALKIVDPIVGAVTGSATTTSSAGSAHTGGLVGRDVPKYHSGGLASDEIPAILQTGEYVVSRRGVEFLDKINRGQYPFTPVQNTAMIVNYNIQALDPISFEEYLERNKGALIQPLIDDINKNGIIITTIRNKL